jgi:hypothetical protein
MATTAITAITATAATSPTSQLPNCDNTYFYFLDACWEHRPDVVDEIIGYFDCFFLQRGITKYNIDVVNTCQLLIKSPAFKQPEIVHELSVAIGALENFLTPIVQAWERPAEPTTEEISLTLNDDLVSMMDTEALGQFYRVEHPWALTQPNFIKTDDGLLIQHGETDNPQHLINAVDEWIASWY